MVENGGQSLHIKCHRTIENLYEIYIETKCYINRKLSMGEITVKPTYIMVHVHDKRLAKFCLIKIAKQSRYNEECKFMIAQSGDVLCFPSASPTPHMLLGTYLMDYHVTLGKRQGSLQKKIIRERL